MSEGRITREHMLLVDQAVTASIAEDDATLASLMGDNPLAVCAVQLAAVLVRILAETEEDGAAPAEWWRTYCQHAAAIREGLVHPDD